MGLTLYVRTAYILYYTPAAAQGVEIYFRAVKYVHRTRVSKICVYLCRLIYNISTFMVICHRNATVYFFLSIRPSFKCPLPSRFVCTSILYTSYYTTVFTVDFPRSSDAADRSDTSAPAGHLLTAEKKP